MNEDSDKPIDKEAVLAVDTKPEPPMARRISSELTECRMVQEKRQMKGEQSNGD